MILENYTDFPDKRIMEIIHFIIPEGISLSDFDLCIKNKFGGLSGNGVAYLETSECDPSNKPLVVVTIPTDERKYPYHYKSKSNVYFDCFYQSREHELVRILSHELRHIWQNKYGKVSEAGADAYAIGRLNSWQERKAKVV